MPLTREYCSLIRSSRVGLTLCQYNEKQKSGQDGARVRLDVIVVGRAADPMVDDMTRRLRDINLGGGVATRMDYSRLHVLLEMVRIFSSLWMRGRAKATYDYRPGYRNLKIFF